MPCSWGAWLQIHSPFPTLLLEALNLQALWLCGRGMALVLVIQSWVYP